MKTKSTGMLWWWVAGAFALLLTAWTAMFIVAAHHPVREVPLAKDSAR
jgi:hypothetical protein